MSSDSIGEVAAIGESMLSRIAELELERYGLQKRITELEASCDWYRQELINQLQLRHVLEARAAIWESAARALLDDMAVMDEAAEWDSK